MSQKETEITIDVTPVVIGIIVLVFGGFILFRFLGNSSANTATQGTSSVVSTVDGKQIIEITVQGGYEPGSVSAKAGVPTILRMKSDNAFGCERALRISSLGIVKTLPANGNTDIEIAAQKTGTRISGSCSMGMYRFVINFN